MDGNPKQEVAEKLRSSSSVLVTVSNNPSVDQLSAALGLSLMLNKLGKHTATVFSGAMPNTIEFLDPEETFDTTVDGLRDFIISLDKEKADKLRYKVEDDVVKIFITPYKDKISESDLIFSEGDFNVDLVVALGVHKRDELDQAITAHGRILHDATIITINDGAASKSSLSAVDWTDEKASSLSEMLVSISEALEGGILDKQMSTAFLTGIVAATERFKNEKTTPKIMTIAAQLMAAGANQQLIAKNLQLPDMENVTALDDDSSQSGELSLDNHKTIDLKGSDKESGSIGEGGDGKPIAMLEDDDLLSDIESSVKAKHDELGDDGRTKKIDKEEASFKRLEDELSHDRSSNLIDLEDKLKSYEKPKPRTEVLPRSPISEVQSADLGEPAEQDEPLMGGTFSSTADQAHNRLEANRESAINNSMLNHENLNLDSVTAKGKDIAPPQDLPSGDDVARDIEEARREVERAMGETDYNGFAPPTSLNAAPISLEDDGGDLNLQSQSFNPNSYNQPQPQPQQPPVQQQNNLSPNPNNGYQNYQQPPAPYPPQVAPGNNQQVVNPMFNNSPQNSQPPQQYPQAQPPQNGQQIPPSPNGQVPPPMPPSAPPPMPPFP